MPFKYLGDWTERVAKGELPFAKPTRPQGVERNIVVTLRDWHNPKQYLHDLIASDRRYPTVNAYGPLYGQCEHACNDMPILDPVKNVATNFVLPTTPTCRWRSAPQCRLGQDPAVLAYWGEENIWDSKATPQLDVRPQGPPVARGDRAQAGQPRLLQKGIEPSLGRRVFRSTAPTAA